MRTYAYRQEFFFIQFSTDRRREAMALLSHVYFLRFEEMDVNTAKNGKKIMKNSIFVFY
jgi:hypothetical protein